MRRLARIAFRASPFVLILLIWQALVVAEIFPPYLFPGPREVLLEFYERTIVDQSLLVNLRESASRVLVGYIPGLGGGILIGVAMGSSSLISRFFSGPVSFFNAIPSLGWVPLAILWFGIGWQSVTFIIFLSTFFPVLFNTLSGIAMIPREYINVARMSEMSRFQISWKVLIPGAFPSIVTGVRIGAAYGWRALIGAEMIASSSGIGWMMIDARQFLRPEIVIMGMITIGLAWLVIEHGVLRPLERRTVERWGMLRQDG